MYFFLVNKVPILIGTNRDEGTGLAQGISKNATVNDYKLWLLNELGPVYGPSVFGMYPPSSFPSPWW